MKKSLIVALIVACTGFVSRAQSVKNATHSTELEEQSTFIKSQSEIEINYSSSNSDGNNLLDIHFKNTSNEIKTFEWTISSTIGIKYQSSALIELRPGEIFIQKSALELKGNGTYEEYPINITTK